jgi:hypothetical protein
MQLTDVGGDHAFAEPWSASNPLSFHIVMTAAMAVGSTPATKRY